MFDAKINDDGVVILSGRLDSAQSDKLRELFATLTDGCDVSFKELEYISSVGLGIFIATHQRLKESGSGLRLKHMNKHIRDVFHYCGLDQIFEIE